MEGSHLWFQFGPQDWTLEKQSCILVEKTTRDKRTTHTHIKREIDGYTQNGNIFVCTYIKRDWSEWIDIQGISEKN